MPGPRPKRQFAGASADPSQRQITNFFTSNGHVTSSSASAARHGDPSSWSSSSTAPPTVPDAVQANLIAVGMRVRKSVPEGYKTGDKHGGGGGLGPPHSTTSGLLRTPAARPSPDAPGAVFSRPRRPHAGERELVPFCGLNKVGGLAPQRQTGAEYDPPGEEDDYDVPGLSSSQSTMSWGDDDRQHNNHQQQPVNARKRFYEEEEDESCKMQGNDDTFPAITFFSAGFVDGGESFGGGAGTGAREAAAARTFAVPRRHKGGFRGGGGGQRNIDGNDFPEAEFLDTEMGG